MQPAATSPAPGDSPALRRWIGTLSVINVVLGAVCLTLLWF